MLIEKFISNCVMVPNSVDGERSGVQLPVNRRQDSYHGRVLVIRLFYREPFLFLFVQPFLRHQPWDPKLSDKPLTLTVMSVWYNLS